MVRRSKKKIRHLKHRNTQRACFQRHSRSSLWVAIVCASLSFRSWQRENVIWGDGLVLFFPSIFHRFSINPSYFVAGIPWDVTQNHLLNTHQVVYYPTAVLIPSSYLFHIPVTVPKICKFIPQTRWNSAGKQPQLEHGPIAPLDSPATWSLIPPRFHPLARERSILVT